MIAALERAFVCIEMSRFLWFRMCSVGTLFMLRIGRVAASYGLHFHLVLYAYRIYIAKAMYNEWRYGYASHKPFI